MGERPWGRGEGSGEKAARPWAKPVADEGQHAAERREAGHLVHTVLVEVPSTQAVHTDHLSDVIEDVEAAGWLLSHMSSLTLTLRAGPVAVLVFRAVDVTRP